MFLYNLRLALENFKRAKLLYALVALTLALGIGLLSANIALINSMMSDPIPHKSEQLFHVSMNTWPQSEPHEEPFYILRYRDASKILEAESAERAAVFFGSGGYIRDAESSSLARTNVSIRATTHGFFALADTPFLYGNAFATDNIFEVVLGDNANNRIFGGGNSVGKSIELNGKHYKVVGVLKPWHLRPRFYHITENQAFFTTDDIFLPLETALDENLPIHGRSSSTDSWYKASDTRDRNVYYLHAWVELSNQQNKMAFQNYLDGYAQSLKDAGEHPNQILNVLHDVNEWIDDRNIVDKRIIAFAIVSVLFLLVCVFNASSLLLARLHAAVFEHGLRRAIGASKYQLMAQGMIESTFLGLITGLLGLLLAYVFLAMSVSFIPAVRNIAVLDVNVMIGGVIVAIIVTNLSNLYPLIRVNHRTISAELK